MESFAQKLGNELAVRVIGGIGGLVATTVIYSQKKKAIDCNQVSPLE